ncbi:hypothetical protein [Lutibacter sp.]|uniref:hypothetical protein n=1 Tax=Lutibacter sp. TaxID=1925666 RepID=UPI003566CF04
MKRIKKVVKICHFKNVKMTYTTINSHKILEAANAINKAVAFFSFIGEINPRLILEPI